MRSIEFMLKHFDRFHTIIRSYGELHQSIMALPKAYDKMYFKLKGLKKRDILFLQQRITRGWDDSETWSLDHSLPKVILPRLRRFKELTIGTPGDITKEEWHSALDKMIAFFEFAGSKERWNASHDEFKKHDEGKELFCKHYYALWW